MILMIPEKRVCEGKTVSFKITDHHPLQWIRTDNPAYAVVSVDGFIINEQKAVNGIFKKLEYIEEKPGEAISLEDITRVIPRNELLVISRLAEGLQCESRIFIWPKNYPAGYDKTLKLVHSIKLHIEHDELKIHTYKKVDISDLEQGIRALRGFSFSHVKHLLTASSNVECYLANNTTNPWPGDIDAMIYDHRLQRFTAIIEFKTHNINTPVAEERIDKYRQEDWRRFNVFFDLADDFSRKLGYRPRLLYVVWGTNENSPHHGNIKIDVIERDKVISSALFARPAYNTFSQELSDYLIQLVNEA
ncbi:hypothetical protein [Chitinophaga sp. OAE865]|uniref:hypothetical protein n=1 Tax=Chitinophaga sp. OAE865 TaxID=2817898 RepID=UPI001AEB54BF